MNQISILGIDLAKNIFQLHGVNKRGGVVLCKQIRREKLKDFVRNLPTCLIGMEACGGAHHWAREFQKMGHQVRLISAQFVKPYVKSNKNDKADSEAIVEAVSRPNMRFVAIKQVWQQDILGLHRVRKRLVRNRTAIGNEIRGLLQEYGLVLPQGFTSLRQRIPMILEDSSNELTPISRELFSKLLEEFHTIDKEIKNYDFKIQQIYESHSTCQRIGKVEGIGVVTATALVASVGDPNVFKNGRQFAAWLGLVPRQRSSGGKNLLLGISKRGDRYLRCLLIHGARSALAKGKNKKSPRILWALEKCKTRGFNKACVAIANKNARIIWALMAHGEEYQAA